MSNRTTRRRPFNLLGFTLLVLTGIGAGFGILAVILHATGAPAEAVLTAAAAAGSAVLFSVVIFSATRGVLPLRVPEGRHDH